MFPNVKRILYRSWSTGRITGERLTLALVLATLLCSSAAAQGIITTVAGGGPTKISARSVPFEPYGVAVDSAGNVLVASETGIFRVDPSGQLTSVGDGCGRAVCSALAVAVANTGTIYSADTENNRVLRIDRTGMSSTVGGGDARANVPGVLAWSVAVDGTGAVYVADAGAHRVRKINTSGVVTTVAGTGTAGFRGDAGPATSAMLSFPAGVAVDGAGILYIADLQNQRIRRVDRNGVMTTVAGSGRRGFSGDGGPATRASLNRPNRVAVDRQGALYVADVGNHRIRKIDTNGTITTVAGNGRAGFSGDGGPATRASLDEPWDVAVSDQGTLYIADTNNSRVRAVAPNGVITTIGGGISDAEFTGDGGPATSALLDLGYLRSGIALDGGGALYITEEFGRVRKVDRNGIITSVARVPNVRSFCGIAVDMAGAIYLASDGRIRKIDTQGTITPVAGNGTFRASGDGGPATSAGMSIWGIAVDRTGALFIAENGNNRVRKVDANGIITTVAGNGTDGSSGDGGPATAASVGSPSAVAVDGDGVLYIAQSGPISRIRKVDRNGVISTVAGDGTAGFSGDGGPATSASLNLPVAVAVDGSGNIYIAEVGRVRKVDASGIITTVAGDGTAGFGGDGGPGIAARLNSPVALAVTSDGTLFISDWGNQRIRMVVDRR
jgi:sugar lactone lactonase YvrE